MKQDKRHIALDERYLMSQGISKCNRTNVLLLTPKRKGLTTQQFKIGEHNSNFVTQVTADRAGQSLDKRIIEITGITLPQTPEYREHEITVGS